MIQDTASADRSTPGRRRRGYTGFFSSARTTWLPVGSNVRPGALGGYHIDFGLKPRTPRWPPAWVTEEAGGRPLLTVVTSQWTAQWGLGCFERHIGGEADAWREAGLEAARFMLSIQERGGEDDGAWLNRTAMTHTFHLDPPWISAMAQGEGASLLIRAHAATGDDRFADGARRALRLLSVPTSRGGVRADLGDGFFLEEYPTQPPSYVLNGGIFALWGLYDTAVGLDDAALREEFERGMDTLAGNIHRWDTGAWSRYDLYPFRVANVASSAYHALHINQLRAMQRIAPRPQVGATLERFESYARSRRKRAAAFARKAAFRLLVPRHRLIARRSPFARPAARQAEHSGSRR